MTEESQSFTMPSSPADRKKIKDALHEMCGAMQFMEDKREFMKDVADSLKEQFEIPKKITMKMARTLYKNNYGDVSNEADQFTTLFESLFQTNTSAVDDLTDED